MNDVIIFAGTTEGRTVAEAAAGQPITLHVCVATEYGETLVHESENVKIHAGRLAQPEMEKLIEDTGALLVIDATHPYAEIVTKTVKQACENTHTEYMRLLRASEQGGDGCVSVRDTAQAAEYLSSVSGNVLLTVGSKELSGYTGVTDYKERLFARILPLPSAVQQAHECGFQGKNLICMQGPFSQEINEAMLRMYDIKWLVTKDTGSAGGFPEKLAAAKNCGVRVIVVERPLSEQGVSLEECIAELSRRFGFRKKKNVTIIGTGTGSEDMMTLGAERACRAAGLIIGAKRLTESLGRFGKKSVNAVLPGDIVSAVRASEEENIVVAMSGDTGFYSGAKKLAPMLGEENVTVLPGISSVIYFCSRLKTGWDDAVLISTHGRECNFIAKIRNNPKVIALTGGDVDAKTLIEALCEYSLGSVKVTVGSELSYETESIVSGTAQELRGRDFPSLAVIMAENEEALSQTVTCGRPDEDFLRAKVPMTKQEVRAVTLSKLMLTKNAVCWDVGAGTGSVTVEMAERCEDGTVYAIEHNAEACALIEENKRHIGVSNIKVIEGSAPEALEELPAPTHVFIGGSSGSQREIFGLILGKNPGARIVINTVTAESFADTVACLKTLPVRDIDITEISVSRGRPVGRYHLMTAQNPVYVISFTGGSEDA